MTEFTPEMRERVERLAETRGGMARALQARMGERPTIERAMQYAAAHRVAQDAAAIRAALAEIDRLRKQVADMAAEIKEIDENVAYDIGRAIDAAHGG